MAETKGAPAQPNVGDAPSQGTMSHPYIGSRISLISKSALRYEGTLYTIDTNESTVALQNVHSFGTEGRTRAEGPVPPCVHPYDFIIFRGQDIADLQVIPNRPPMPTQYHDPAIIASATPQQMTASAYNTAVSQPQVSQMHRVQQPNRSHAVQPPAAQPNHSAPLPVPAKTEDELKEKSKPSDSAKNVGGPKPSQWGPPPTTAWGPPPKAATANGVESNSTPEKPQENSRDGASQHLEPALRQPQQVGKANGDRRDAKESGPGNGNWRNGGPNGDGRDRNGGRGRGRGRGGYGRGGRRFRRRGPGITVPQEDFDFESMHQKFDKASISESAENGIAFDGLPDVAPKYDKSKGFFDELVPEKQMPRERTNAAQRRRTDFETFGEFGNFVRHNRYGRRGRGRGRGRGRSYSNNRQTGNE